MTKKSISIKEAPVFKENPFVEKAIERIEENTVNKRRFLKGSKGVEHAIINRESEIVGHTAFLQQVEVDEDKFAKLYLSQFAGFWELTKPAIRVFGYIIENLLPRKDFVFIDFDEAVEYTKYSSTKMVYVGLAKLVELGVIARTSNRSKYFINPLMFFNGDRVTFAKTYVKKRKKQNEENSRQKKMDFWDDALEPNKMF
jgi:hypothetical protein